MVNFKKSTLIFSPRAGGLYIINMVYPNSNIPLSRIDQVPSEAYFIEPYKKSAKNLSITGGWYTGKELVELGFTPASDTEKVLYG